MKSSAKTSLGNLSVVITRPVEQAAGLATLVERSGGRPVIFPTIEITGRRFDDRISDQLQGLNTADWVIFISTHAVRYGLECIRLAGASLDQVRIASIGGATTRALLNEGQVVALECPPPPGSESLLSTLEMSDVEGEKFVVIRGTGGRELLGGTLRDRGAEVKYVECYERRCPRIPIDAVLEAIISDHGAVFVTTSVNGLENLLEMTPGEAFGHIINSRLVVAGERQLREARRIGWKGEVVAARDAGNTSVLEKLLESKAAIDSLH
jgi:uroporphyrinogen-III synthase